MTAFQWSASEIQQSHQKKYEPYVPDHYEVNLSKVVPQGKKQLFSLISQLAINYLDRQSLSHVPQVCRSWRDYTPDVRTILLFQKRLQVLKQTQDIYALLEMHYPQLSFGDHVAKSSLKDAIAGAIRPYKLHFKKFNLIKLIGKDYRKNPVNFREPFLAGNKEFYVTPESATILCEHIEEDPRIDGLVVFSAQPGLITRRSFGSDVANIFSTQLPPSRLKMLIIYGASNYQSNQIFSANFRRLFDGVKLSTQDILFHGTQMSLQEGAHADALMDKLLDDKHKREHNVTFQRHCIIL